MKWWQVGVTGLVVILLALFVPRVFLNQRVNHFDRHGSTPTAVDLLDNIPGFVQSHATVEWPYAPDPKWDWTKNDPGRSGSPWGIEMWWDYKYHDKSISDTTYRISVVPHAARGIFLNSASNGGAIMFRQYTAEGEYCNGIPASAVVPVRTKFEPTVGKKWSGWRLFPVEAKFFVPVSSDEREKVFRLIEDAESRGRAIAVEGKWLYLWIEQSGLCGVIVDDTTTGRKDYFGRPVIVPVFVVEKVNGITLQNQDHDYRYIKRIENDGASR